MGFLKSVSVTALTVVVLSAVATRGAAQSAAPLTIPTARQTQFDLTGMVAYDSNVAQSDRQLAALRGLKLADELFEPSADFVLARPVGQNIFFLEGNAGYLFHRVNTVLDRQDVNISGGVNARFLRCQEVVSGGYASFQSDLSETQLQVVKNTVDIGTVGGSVTCGHQIGLAPGLAVSGTWRTNSAGALEQLNTNSVSVSPSLAYQRPAFGSLGIFGNFIDTQLSNNVPQGINSVALGGYDIYVGGFRYDRHIGGRIEGSVAVSYTSLVQNTPGQPNFSGFTFVADGTYHASSRLLLHANATRETIPSQQLGVNFAVEELYTADMTYNMSSRVSARLIATSETEDYKAQYFISPFEFRHQVITTITAISSFRLNRRISLNFLVSDTERSANVQGFGYSSTRAELQAKAAF